LELRGLKDKGVTGPVTWAVSKWMAPITDDVTVNQHHHTRAEPQRGCRSFEIW
jgi:hypothetical protein